MTAIYPGQKDRVRHCASMAGHAIWYSVRLAVLTTPVGYEVGW
mgnify:FL=1